MMEPWWIVLLAAAVCAVVGLLVWRPWRTAVREARYAEAFRQFHLYRERLEAKFIQLAESRNLADSADWEDAEFGDEVAFVRHRATGELSAFVPLTVGLSDYDLLPVESSDLIGNLRVATVVFRFDGRHWDTDGRAMLNLKPEEAIRLYQRELEVVAPRAVSNE